jgi:L-arabinose isomerase
LRNATFKTACAAWIHAGGAHHTVLSRALDPEPLVDFAEMAGIELILIDDSSTLRGVRNEIRWNQAYYHLARGV